MAQHTGRRPVDTKKPKRADVAAPFDWADVKCEWNQNFCQGASVALVETGATVMIAAQAPEGMRAPRHLCAAHLRSYLRYAPKARIVQKRDGVA